MGAAHDDFTMPEVPTSYSSAIVNPDFVERPAVAQNAGRRFTGSVAMDVSKTLIASR
jgi:hypothetical protein